MQEAFGNTDRRMLRRFEIICFTNNSNPHAFLFLSDQLGHIWKKKEEISLGRQKCSAWWHDTSYGFTYSPRKCHILKKKEEISFGATKMQCIWWHDTSYGQRTSYDVRTTRERTWAGLYASVIFWNFHLYVRSAGKSFFNWPEFKSPYRYWICFIHQTQAVS